mmetsp:Transcript_18210/g.55823  ORF Transcript_18210/g.55823 Transcript_18210/m.55823 type:complete len:722 (-) Transcript_18210:277-2442(-)
MAASTTTTTRGQAPSQTASSAGWNAMTDVVSSITTLAAATLSEEPTPQRRDVRPPSFAEEDRPLQHVEDQFDSDSDDDTGSRQQPFPGGQQQRRRNGRTTEPERHDDEDTVVRREEEMGRREVSLEKSKPSQGQTDEDEPKSSWLTSTDVFGSGATSDLLWGTEEEANPYRDEIVRTIFGDVGAIRRDFSCAIERKILLHGRLYVTDRFICFYSNLFGFEKKIKIPYSYITCITKEYTAVFIPNAIAVITARKEYIFRSFWDRDECYAVLKQMHDLYRGVVETGPHAHIEEGNAVVGAGGSSILGHYVGAVSSSLETGDEASSVVKTTPRERASPVGEEDDEAVLPEDADGAAEQQQRRDQPRDSTLSESDATRPASSGTKRKPPRTTTTASSAPASTADAQHRRRPSSKQLAESSASLISLANITALGALAHELTATTLPITIDKFFEHFLADDAPFSLAKFHEFQRDAEVSVTPWTEVPQKKTTPENSSEHTRVVRFRRRLKSPIGPASTRTTKMQRCRCFGRRGIVVNTVMTMEDIPYRDCFTVEDRWVAEPSADGRETRVRFEFQVAWTKTTIWKRRIEVNSKADLEGFYEAYVQAAHAYLADLAARAERKHRRQRLLDAQGNARRDDVATPKTTAVVGAASLAKLLRSLDAGRRLFHSVFVVHRVSWLVALFVLLFLTLVKQHRALEDNFKVQQQLLSELAALRADLACARPNHGR